MSDIANGNVTPGEIEVVGDLFRQSMRRMASAVSIVACEHEGEWIGMSATSVTSLSMDPPSLLVCINKSASLSPALLEGKAFSINLLDRRHQAVSNAFGNSKLRDDRFRAGGWILSDAGIPVMSEALTAVECRVAKLVEYGTHSIVVGQVCAVHLGDGVDPLIYCDGKYQ